MQDLAVFSDIVKTPFGVFQVEATERGMARICFPGRHAPLSASKRVPSKARQALNQCKLFLRCFFSHQVYERRKVPIDWSFFTPFERRVLSALKRFSPLTPISYSALAKKAGVPQAARAVGHALNRNPVPILIPCHQVVRADNSLGGYRSGIRWKRVLLKLDRSRRTARDQKGNSL